ncbi:hypothetical protein JG687_00009663 [Phytophthora cactorum]|uniref:Ubiquitin-like domain-containing protein n=1 Tax=Phytophthora cactorum TaxID=29920 RepID=A0A8T1UDY6_9STRA|nr:hypothetical protein JG687_00009663 [Phytophthora cactorum]
MADDASAASPPSPAQLFIQTPPDSPLDVAESAASAPADDSLHLRLKTLDERVFDVEATSSMSVADFRAKVALATAVPVPRQRLIYRGKLLKDGVALAAYDLQDGHTVHLVAKPPANSATSSTTQTANEDARQREVNGPAWNLSNLRSALRRTGATTTTQPLPMLREILDEMAESPQEVAEGMGLGGLNGPRRQELAVDLEPITQGILTMRTVLSTAVQEQEEQEDERIEEDAQVEQQTDGHTTTQRGPRQFFVGQWLDVKDTVNQWLESTVMAIADGKVLIHYHGWPTRWDEWIDVESDRIAAFRTRTLHTQNTQRMSPVPTTRVPSAPRVGDNDVRRMVVDVRNLMREMLPHIDRLAGLCEEDLRREQERGRAQNEAESDNSSTGPSGPTAPTTLEPGQARESEVSEMAHLVAPLFDRFGRLLVDSAGYFDPLLRPELRGTSQRQQERHSTVLRRGHGGSTQRQAASVSASMEAQDNSLSIRDLIATSPNTASESNQPRRSIDVHIHAIVAPASLSSLASLTRGNSDTNNNESGSTRRVQTPSTPPIGRSFGFDDNRDEADHSRVPLLDGYRHRSHSSESNQQRRAVARELDDFLSDDFFGTSFGHEDDDSDNESNVSHSDAMQSTYRPPSPSVAAAEERLRARAAEGQRDEDGHSSDNGRTGLFPKVAYFTDVESNKVNEETFIQLAPEIFTCLHFDELGKVVIENAKSILDADRCSLFVADNATRTLHNWHSDISGAGVKVYQRSAQKAAAGMTIHFGQGIVGLVAEAQEAINIPDAYDDPRFNSAWDQKTHYRTKSMLTVPILSKIGEKPKSRTEDDKSPPDQTLLGVVQVINKSGGAPFRAKDEFLLQTISKLIALAIENSQLFQRNQELCWNVGKLIADGDLVEAIVSLGTAAEQIIGVEGAAVYVVDPDTQELVTFHHKRRHRIALSEATYAGSLMEEAVRSQQLTIVNDMAKTGSFNAFVDSLNGISARNVLFAPLIVEEVEGIIPGMNRLVENADSGESLSVDSGQKMVGLLQLVNTTRRKTHFDQHDLFLSIVQSQSCSVLAAILEKQRMLRQKEQIALLLDASMSFFKEMSVVGVINAVYNACVSIFDADTTAHLFVWEENTHPVDKMLERHMWSSKISPQAAAALAPHSSATNLHHQATSVSFIPSLGAQSRKLSVVMDQTLRAPTSEGLLQQVLIRGSAVIVKQWIDEEDEEDSTSKPSSAARRERPKVDNYTMKAQVFGKLRMDLQSVYTRKEVITGIIDTRQVVDEDDSSDEIESRAGDTLSRSLLLKLRQLLWEFTDATWQVDVARASHVLFKGEKMLSKSELEQALGDTGISLEIAEWDQLYACFEEENGLVDVETMLTALQPELKRFPVITYELAPVLDTVTQIVVSVQILLFS